MRQVDVVGVRVEMPRNVPMVLLREVEGSRYLSIWIGASEAAAIANAQEGLVPQRPLTHDLIVDILAGLDKQLSEVRITELTDNTFYAVLVIDGVEISSRTSDAIAIAIRTGTTIYCAEEVLDAVGIVAPDEEQSDEPEEEQVEKFREFLDQVVPEDFA